MSTKGLVMLGMIVGSTVGSFIPALWGADLLSFWSVILSGVGGLLGIYLGYKLGQYIS